MGATGNYKHVDNMVGSVAVGAAFVNAIPVILSERTLLHSACFIDLDTIAGGATKCTLRITADAAGNISLVPDTEADISLGITDPTVGSAVYKTDIIIGASNTIVYVWAKVDIGTANAISVSIAGRE